MDDLSKLSRLEKFLRGLEILQKYETIGNNHTFNDIGCSEYDPGCWAFSMNWN